MLFSWPYPEAPIEGYWGKPTSLIDWCEENYVVSPYIAEWSNTITNSIFLMTAFYSTYSAWRNKLETRYILIGMGFSLVGWFVVISYDFTVSLSIARRTTNAVCDHHPIVEYFCRNSRNLD